MSRFQDGLSPGRGRDRGSSRSIKVPPLVACQSVMITWTGQTPFHVTIMDSGDDGAVLEDFGETSASSTSWTVDRDAKEVVFALSDASGETTFSYPQPIQPGDCSPRTTESEMDPMAQVFTSATTKYEAFSSAVIVTAPTTTTVSTSSTSLSTTSETPSPSSSSTSLSSTTPASSTSSSTSTTSSPPTTEAVKAVTFTRTKSSSGSMGGEVTPTVSSSEVLIRSTALSSGLLQKEGSKTGIAVGVSLGLGIPILLIFLAYYLHRRRAERTEEPYAKFADLHSRPQSSFTSRSASSIYSLRTDDMLARPIPPVPPIPAAFDEKRKSLASITSFGLPYEWQGGRGFEELSPDGPGSGVVYEGGHKREGSEMGDSVYGGIDGRR